METFWGTPTNPSIVNRMALCAAQGDATNAALVAKTNGDMAEHAAQWKIADSIADQLAALPDDEPFHADLVREYGPMIGDSAKATGAAYVLCYTEQKDFRPVNSDDMRDDQAGPHLDHDSYGYFIRRFDNVMYAAEWMRRMGVEEIIIP